MIDGEETETAQREAFVARILLLFAMLPIALIGTRSEAQFGFTAGQSTGIDPSVRLSGMGRTGTAVFWGSDLNDWANPALLPYNRGLRYERSKTQLVPDLARDVFFTTNRMLWGRWGVGLAMAGWPIDAVGGNKVDYGVTVVTDANGNDVGKVHTTEDDNTIGVGMNAAQALENAGLALGHRLPPISHFADVSLGHTWKRVKYREEGTAAFFGSASVNEKDRGYLLRVTPYDAIGYPGMVPWLESILRVKIEASYGAAEQNDGDRVVTYSTGTTLPVIQDHRQGRAFRVGIAFPQSVENSWHREGRSWIYELLTPLVSYGSTSERSQRYLRGTVAGDEVNRRGWEITVANIFSYREGHVDDPTSTVIGQTFGWGVGLHLGDLAGVQYDHATVPQSVYLANVKRNGFSLHLDPVRVIRGLR